MKLNKYLSFDISLHQTFYDINKHSHNTSLRFETLLGILDDNWLSKGYQSKHEELAFRDYATTALKLYFLNPLDKGYDIVLLNKFITGNENSQFWYAKVDKLHFLSNGQLELVDYKSGNYIPPTNESFFSSKLLFTITSIKERLGVYPDIFSLYYLRRGIKLSTYINLDTMFNIQHISPKQSSYSTSILIPKSAFST